MFNGLDEHPLAITDADVAAWPWLGDQVEERDGRYYPARIRGDFGDPAFQIQFAARRLGVDVRCVDGILCFDLDALRGRVEEHHWLRQAEGFLRCPACGEELSEVSVLPPTYARPA